jgi:hypothetical protein
VVEIISETKIFALGKRKLLRGWLCERDDGEKVYYARKRHGDIYRVSHSSISSAMQCGEASWAIDEVLLYNLRAKKVKYIGVRTIDTHDEYLTELEVFFDKKKHKIRDFTGVGRGGARQRHVPLQYFTKISGAVDVAA